MFTMVMLLVAISTTLLCFLSAAACLRFLFSRQGWFWVLPLVISLAFLYISITPLFQLATGLASGSYRVEISPDRSVREIVPLIIVLLWYTMIVTFRYALKLVVPDNKHLLDTMKNVKEANYMQKIELRTYHKESARHMKRQIKIEREQAGIRYPRKWIALFDDHD
jgi:uncharacterized membrane protein